MGDELHMRNNAATNLFVKTIAETLCEVVESRAALTQIMHFLTWNNDQFFLNFAMAANKACADAAHGIEHSTMVTAMARNGVNIGIRVSGLGDRWFTAPAADVAGAYFRAIPRRTPIRTSVTAPLWKPAALAAWPSLPPPPLSVSWALASTRTL